MQNIDRAVESKNLEYMSDSQLNKNFLIQNTDHNLNRRYSERVRNIWRKMYDAGDSAYLISRIFGASYPTVRTVVDPEYRFNLSEKRSEYNRRYRETHDAQYDPEYRYELISRKRKLVSDDLYHLVII